MHLTHFRILSVALSLCDFHEQNSPVKGKGKKHAFPVLLFVKCGVIHRKEYGATKKFSTFYCEKGRN